MMTTASAFGISEHEHHKGGYMVALMLLLARVSYIFDKDDPEFIHRGADLFEGSMRLYAFGRSVRDVAGIE